MLATISLSLGNGVGPRTQKQHGLRRSRFSLLVIIEGKQERGCGMPPTHKFHASGVAMRAAAYSNLKGLPTSCPAAHCPFSVHRKRSRSTMFDTISVMLRPLFSERGVASIRISDCWA